MYYVFSKQNFLIAVSLLILFFYFFLHAILQLSFNYSSLKWLALIIIIFSLMVCALFGYSLFRASVLHFGYRPILPKDYTDFILLISPVVIIITMHVLRIVQMLRLKK
jgi:glucan phosphoethanolaminetransferase (alkaline phosphatase superfamily)